MQYQPPRALGLLVGAVLIAWSLGVTLLLLLLSFGRDIDVYTVGIYLGAAVALAVATLFGYWTYALATLSYSVDRNGLVITWGPVRQVVPLTAIERLVPGTSVGVPRVRGVSWLGHHVGLGVIDRIGPVMFYSTHQAPEQVLYVMTNERSYAICVTDPTAFAREIQVRQNLGPTAEVRHHVERLDAPIQAFWADNTGRGLAGLGLLLCIALWAAVGFQYSGLPEFVNVHFPAYETVAVAEEASRGVLLEIPRMATFLLALNLAVGFLLYTWERAAAYAVFVAASLLQLGFLVAFQVAIYDL